MRSLDLGLGGADILAQGGKDAVVEMKSGFRKITKMNRLQHTVCSLISNVISKSESASNNLVKKLFHEMDCDNNGVLTADEFTSAMASEDDQSIMRRESA